MKNFIEYLKLDEKSMSFLVRYKKKQNGQFSKTWFDNEPAAKKFLADIKKNGGSGTVEEQMKKD